LGERSQTRRAPLAEECSGRGLVTRTGPSACRGQAVGLARRALLFQQSFRSGIWLSSGIRVLGIKYFRFFGFIVLTIGRRVDIIDSLLRSILSSLEAYPLDRNRGKVRL
jgi:hypothetical protein